MKLKRRRTFVCFRFYVLRKSPKSLATKSIIGYNYNVCIIERGEISGHSSTVSKSVIDFFSGKTESEIQKYISLCQQADQFKKDH